MNANGSSRRQFLGRMAGVVVVAGPLGPLLVSCGGDDSSDAEGSGTGGVDTTAAAPSGASSTAAPDQSGGSFRVASTYASNVEPILLSDSPGIAVVQPTAAYLLKSNAALALEPWLATEWMTADGGVTWDFTLRADALFHDGRPVTADDVAATFRRLSDKEIGSPLAYAMDFLEPDGVTVAGDGVVRFTLSRPVAQFPYFTTAYQAAILPADYEVGTFADNPIGCGPFRLTSYAPRGDARYEAFADYFIAGEPRFAELTIVGFESEDAVVPALLAGDVDATVISAPSQNRQLEGQDGVEVLQVIDARHLAVHLKTTSETWGSADVRRALAMTIDRQAYVDGILDGAGEVGQDHVVAPIMPDHVALADRREADIDGAKTLLETAGASNVTDTIYFPAELPDHRDMAVYLQDRAREAGFSLEVEAVPLAEFFEQINGYNIAVVGWGHRNTAAEFFRTGYTSDAPFNYGAWSNAEFDDLVDQLDSITDPDERRTITEQIERLMFDEVPAIIPIWPGQTRAVRTDISGFAPTPALLMPVAQAART